MNGKAFFEYNTRPFLTLCVHILEELMISVLRYGKDKLSNVVRMFSLLPGKH